MTYVPAVIRISSMLLGANLQEAIAGTRAKDIIGQVGHPRGVCVVGGGAGRATPRGQAGGDGEYNGVRHTRAEHNAHQRGGRNSQPVVAGAWCGPH